MSASASTDAGRAKRVARASAGTCTGRPAAAPLSGPARRGATLLELLIASTILLMSLVPLFELFGGSITRAELSRQELMARCLAGEAIAQMRLVPFRALPMDQEIVIACGPGRPATGNFADRNSRIPMVLGSYPVKLTLRIFVEPLDPPDLLARIAVNVSAPADGGAAASTVRAVSLVELVENRVGGGETP
jgi:hypothetical protein